MSRRRTALVASAVATGCAVLLIGAVTESQRGLVGRYYSNPDWTGDVIVAARDRAPGRQRFAYDFVDPDNLTMRYNFACILAANLQDKEAALKMLATTLSRSGTFQVMVADTDTDFDSIRDDPRFQKMIADAKKRHGIKDDPVAATPAPNAAAN